MWPHMLAVGLLFSVLFMCASRRVNALITAFKAQSVLLALLTASLAWTSGEKGLWAVTALIVAVKVMLIPRHLVKISSEMGADGNMGLLINPPLSVMAAALFGWLVYSVSAEAADGLSGAVRLNFSLSFLIAFTGLFLMMSRLKALAQIVGLLVMENGVFLLASSVSGGMPFIVEIAVFLDLLALVVVAGIFVYRIKGLFTHIDVGRLTRLKG